MVHAFSFYSASPFSQLHNSAFLRKKAPWWYKTLDPRSTFVTRWNHIFLIACLIALFIDPLFFFIPVVGGPACIHVNLSFGIAVTFLRTIADFFYIFHMVIKFRTAFVAPNSRVFGRGELVMDPKAIAIRYLKNDFIVDFTAMLPLPQIVIWFVIPAIKNPRADHAHHMVSLIVLAQYFPRLYLMFPLQRRIVKTTGVIAKTPWTGAAYNLLLCTLASHVIGATWYLWALERQHGCWRAECLREMHRKYRSCKTVYLDCSSLTWPDRVRWLNTTKVSSKCDAFKDKNHQVFGIFAAAFTEGVANANFVEKYFYCLWWGLRNLSSYGQNLMTTTLKEENMFSIMISIAGLIFFSHLIGNIQTYLQSSTVRLEEWRVKRRDTEEWMRHRQLPPELQNRVRRFVQYRWLATRGVDEETILQSLPPDLRRQIRRHLCLALVCRVPFFAQMDDLLLDAICERLVSSLHTKEAYIIKEGDPVNEMLFIIRGQVESSTTDGGRSGFFNTITLRPGDFCGEELLTWALVPTSMNLPSSTRTVKTLTELEAFALRAEDLKFVASQFKRLHSKRLQHAFRYYSHQWRTWGACFMQAAWRRYKKRKMAMELAQQESSYYNYINIEEGDDEYDEGEESVDSPLIDDESKKQQRIGATILASRFAKNTRKGASNAKVGIIKPDDLKMPKLFKPKEPDFS